MCGFYFSNNKSEDLFKSRLEKINHRGPDYTGIHRENILSFGHKRLSIIDLDKRSNQPFITDKYILLFNGEIYNYKEIKDKLIHKGYSFKTKSDTEVLLFAYDYYKEKLPSILNGMFSFLIFDKIEDTFFGARDRTGQKPFFYYLNNDEIEFSSELTPLINDDFKIDDFVLGEYLLSGTIPSAKSIIRNINKIKPGHYFKYSFNEKELIQTKYWENKKTKLLDNRNINEHLQNLDSLINDATKKRLLESDVKTGIFLSGGIDSTIITKYGLQNQKNTSTLSVKFVEDKFDESKFAELVSKVYDSNHQTIVCSISEVKKYIKNIGSYLDEPMDDSSILAQFLISEVAKENGYKVVLTGDGADEYFFGYKRYLWMKKLILLKKLKFNSIINKKLIPKRYSRYYEALSLDGHQMYEFLMSGLDLRNFKFISKQLNTLNSNKINYYDCADIDKDNYLVNDINIKVDRATMAHSIEARSPFLDHRVIEYSNKLPRKFKLNKGEQKYILKELLRNDFDESFINRSKQGFGVPLGSWLKNDFYDQIENSINKNYHIISSYLDKKYVLSLLNELKNGNFNNQHIIWRIFVLFEWYDKKRSN